jgi:phospholipid/cholesterol/gamma-HCH transport system permease protein
MSLREARRETALRVSLDGAWTARRIGELEPAVLAIELAGLRQLDIDCSAAERVDLSGAWLIHDLAKRAAAAGLAVTFAGECPATVRLVEQTLASDTGPPFARLERHLQPVTALGRSVVDRWRSTLAGLAFIGEAALRFGRGFLDPRAWRPISIARHVYDTGVNAIPIVALIAFLISVIIAYMGAQQLQKFGADIFVVDLVTVGVLRELGVLLTAIIVAGRSGSAFAAEIGAMRLNQEVDALKATGVDPVEVLILPRWIGLVIALPLLTVIADAVGILGGALLCHALLDMPLVQYFQRAEESIADFTFWAGIVKAPVFALLIAASGTYRGLQVRGSSRELGRLTTVAVVQSIFLVILADALFAVLFMEMGI